MLSFLKSALLLLLLTSYSAFAGLMTTTVTPVAGTVGPYSMTGFNLPTPDGSSADSATSLNNDVVNFTDISGSPVSMTVGDVADPDDAWWSGSSSSFYYAGFDTNWLELIMPSNTLAFSLSIDANVNSKAWIIGVADDGSAIDTKGNAFNLLSNGQFDPDPQFNIPLTGPAKSYGFYANNSADSCNSISKVVIDPKYWGMGDFSIHVDENACSNAVPAPPAIWLFGIGLIGLAGFSKRKKAA
jgi:hypothetical protein